MAWLEIFSLGFLVILHFATAQDCLPGQSSLTPIPVTIQDTDLSGTTLFQNSIAPGTALSGNTTCFSRDCPYFDAVISGDQIVLSATKTFQSFEKLEDTAQFSLGISLTCGGATAVQYTFAVSVSLSNNILPEFLLNGTDGNSKVFFDVPMPFPRGLILNDVAQTTIQVIDLDIRGSNLTITLDSESSENFTILETYGPLENKNNKNGYTLSLITTRLLNFEDTKTVTITATDGVHVTTLEIVLTPDPINSVPPSPWFEKALYITDIEYTSEENTDVDFIDTIVTITEGYSKDITLSLDPPALEDVFNVNLQDNGEVKLTLVKRLEEAELESPIAFVIKATRDGSEKDGRTAVVLSISHMEDPTTTTSTTEAATTEGCPTTVFETTEADCSLCPTFSTTECPVCTTEGTMTTESILTSTFPECPTETTPNPSENTCPTCPDCSTSPDSSTCPPCTTGTEAATTEGCPTTVFQSTSFDCSLCPNFNTTDCPTETTPNSSENTCPTCPDCSTIPDISTCPPCTTGTTLAYTTSSDTPQTVSLPTTTCDCSSCPTDNSVSTNCPACSTETSHYTDITACPTTCPECPTETVSAIYTSTSQTVCPDCPTTCSSSAATCPDCSATCPDCSTTCLSSTEHSDCPLTCPDCSTVLPLTTCPDCPTSSSDCPTQCPDGPTNCPECPITCPTNIPEQSSTNTDCSQCPITSPIECTTVTVCPECPTTCPATSSSCPECPTSPQTEGSACTTEPSENPAHTTDHPPNTSCPSVCTECPVTCAECPTENPANTSCPSVCTECPVSCPECPTENPACPTQGPSGEHPHFTVTSPYVIGYPDKGLTSTVIPQNVVALQATVAGETSSGISYEITENSDQFLIHRLSGVVYPTESFSYRETNFKARAQAAGLTSDTLEVQVKIISATNVVVMNIEGQLPEDIHGNFADAEENHGCSVRVLQSAVVPQDNNIFRKFSTRDEQSSLLYLVVYALNTTSWSPLLSSDFMSILKIINENWEVSELDVSSTGDEDSELLPAVIALSVLLGVFVLAAVGAAMFYVFKIRPRTKNDIHEYDNFSEGDSNSINKENAVLTEPSPTFESAVNYDSPHKYESLEEYDSPNNNYESAYSIVSSATLESTRSDESDTAMNVQPSKIGFYENNISNEYDRSSSEIEPRKSFVRISSSENEETSDDKEPEGTLERRKSMVTFNDNVERIEIERL